jgi:CrcB protein
MEPERHEPHEIGHHVAHLLGADDNLPVDPDLAPPGLPPLGRVRRPGWALAAVVAGGFLGTLGRDALGLAWPSGPAAFPAATFVINTSGAFLLGLLLTLVLERFGPTRYLQPFAATGVLGGWTTYSTLAVQADTLVRGGHWGPAALYLGASLVAGLAAAALGILLGRMAAAPDRSRGAGPTVAVGVAGSPGLGGPSEEGVP